MELNVLRHDRSISSLHIGRCLPTHVVQLLTKVALPYKVQHIAVHLTQLAFRPVAIANIIALHDGAGSSFDVVYDNRDTPLFTTPLFPWALAIVMESLPTDTVSLEFFVQADNAAPDVDTWHEADESARSTLSLYHRLCPESPHLRPLDVMFMSCPAPIFVNDRIARALCPQTTFCLLQDLTVTTITTQLELDYLCQHLPDTVETLELSIESDHHPLSCELKHAPSLRSFTYTDNLVRADPIDWSSYRGPLLHLPQGVRSVSIPLTFSTIVFEEPDKITHVTLQRCRYTRSSSCCTYNRALGATFAALSESGVENVELTLHLPSKTHFKDEPSARPLTPCDCWTDLLALCREEPLTWIQDLRIHMSRFRPSVYVRDCNGIRYLCFTEQTIGLHVAFDEDVPIAFECLLYLQTHHGYHTRAPYMDACEANRLILPFALLCKG